ncbi:response regulator [Brevibacillus laterosporus]|uniref:DNA-binding response regulator n=1 Tax=Brevibacillus laterosporus TaxID=1465 RepID=A0AAP8QGS8_BRELA|nr:response regulator transcription factor [Brevibacillus laterosporus]MCR8980181.1 response regulator transcription factor [Brevibacillus laterosporus]MCZ0807336.1 response regulator transcription factor [Brevibacillus laterosporus]MCZ0825555.1 response regulator transcription factor [Brevibacillus laterosporus]MCZ0849332.1 response regulator transcription factor [Brevibacillus laterosporus]MED1664764.1 response regulator transcription factor [Brevibacillus laterosporus]
MEQTVQIMLVDDHSLLRSGLKLLLHKKPSLKVVGEAADGVEAIQLYEDIRPHILILDISMPRLDGIQVLREIKMRHEQAKVIVLTMHEDEDYITSIMHAGASGYVPKAAVDEELYTAIDTVMNGYVYLRPKETQTLISSILKRTPSETDSRNPYVILSPREREVLRFLARGYSLVETAQELMLSIKTVDTHKTRIMNKLNVSRKRELVEYAMKYNLLNDEQA